MIKTKLNSLLIDKKDHNNQLMIKIDRESY